MCFIFVGLEMVFLFYIYELMLRGRNYIKRQLKVIRSGVVYSLVRFILGKDQGRRVGWIRSIDKGGYKRKGF